MLVLTRSTDERIRISIPDGREIEIVVVRVCQGKVRIGIEAPTDLPVIRSELGEGTQQALRHRRPPAEQVA